MFLKVKASLIYMPALFSLSVGVLQLYLCEVKKLSRWKGGGFGMYSELHPKLREIWVLIDGGKWVDLRPLIKSNKAKAAFFTAQCYPSDENLSLLAEIALGEARAVGKIEVFQLENRQNQLSYEKLRSYNVNDH